MATNKKKEASVSEQKPAKKVLRVKDVDLKELVEVRSCVHGGLFYKSKEGFIAEWSSFGDSVFMSVEELLKMRNQQVSFFEKNWIMITGDNSADIVNFLQIEKYYKDIPGVDDIDKIFDYSPKKIISEISKLPASMKETIARRAYYLIQDKKIHDTLKIEAIEEGSGYKIQGE